jgi:hypothetical protein
LEDAAERDEALAAKFDVESPDTVAIVAHATETERSVEAVWRDVSTWKTTRRRILLLERALRTDSNGTADRRTLG